MKKILTVLLAFNSVFSFSQVGIGTNTPNANAVLELSSTTQGMKFPRLTTSQRTNIVLPAKGLTVFDTQINCLMTNFGTPSVPVWKCIGGLPIAVVSAYTCTTASAGTMTAGVAVSGVTQTITATVTSVGTYSITTTANGVTFSGSGTFSGTGAQDIVLTATGTPAACSSYNFTLNTSPSCSFTRIVTTISTAVVDVINPATGKIWMDRNLGASAVATASTTVAAYGDLYQWGRLTDGHQCRTSATTNTFSSTDVPGNANYITTSDVDWRSPSNPNLWQGLTGINNPCPSGYRLPTEAEWTAERTTWSSSNAAGAFGSPLKLPGGGGRRFSDGGLFDEGTFGYYSSSDVSGDVSSRFLLFNSTSAGISSNSRSWAYSVRCIKGDVTSGGSAVVSAYSCSTASAGTMTAGTAVSGVTQTITATVTTIGTYNISAIANGVTFNATGTFTGTGSQAIVLTATGTPTYGTTNAFILNTTPNCSFDRTTSGNASSNGTAVVSAYSCSTASAGTMTAGSAVSGVTQTITATVTTLGTYSISTTANGVTFSGSGTFAGTGSQNIVLMATGTPTAANASPYTYTLNTTPNCDFTRVVNQPSSNGTAVVSSYSCSTASAGTMTAGVAVSGVTQTITATVTSLGTYSISKTANGITFSGSGTFSGTGAQNIVLTATGTPTAAGSSTFSLNTTPNCSFTRVINQPSSNGTAVVSAYSSTASAGTMTAGVAVSGVTQTITATVTTVGTYTISAIANGVTFNGTGTFAGTGSQAIVLTATGTPTAAGSHSFTLNTTPNCGFSKTTN